MKSRFLGGVGVLAALLGMLLLSTPAASAAAAVNQTFWVSKNPVSAPHNSCTHPAFNTIQAAINAVTTPAGTVRVCPGTYSEQLTLNKNISIISAGAPQPVVTYPATPVASTCNPSPTAGVGDYDVVDVCSHTLTIDNMSIAGPYGSLNCTIDDFGIAVTGGATLKASGVNVKNIRQDPLNGCQGGIGILVGRQSTNNVGHAVLYHVNVVNYQKGGLEVSNGGSTATVTGTNINGPGETNQIAPNGVEVIDGGLLNMQGGAVNGNECDVNVCGPNPETQTQSGGFLLIDPAVHTQIQNTQISNNDIGIYNFVGPDTFTNPIYPSTGAVPLINNVALNNNRYEGILFDSGKAVVKKSVISGGQYGAAIYTYVGQSPAPAGTVYGSQITGATTDGVVALNDGSADPFAPNLNVNNSGITGNAYGVQNNDYPSMISAQKDWWGDPTGPSDWSFGSGNATSANVNFFPWATASNGATMAACNQTGATINDNTASGNVILCAASTGSSTIQETGGANVLVVGGGSGDTETGGTGNDYLIGTSGNDTLNALAGASSSLQGRGGTDTCVPSGTNARTDHC